MTKIIEYEEISETLAYIVEHMATKEDIADIRKEMATKKDLFALQTQINSIEIQTKDIKRSRLEVRVADLEEKVFGKSKR